MGREKELPAAEDLSLPLPPLPTILPASSACRAAGPALGSTATTGAASPPLTDLLEQTSLSLESEGCQQQQQQHPTQYFTWYPEQWSSPFALSK